MDLGIWDDIQDRIFRVPVEASAGDNELVPAVSEKKIVVMQIALSTGVSTMQLQDGSGGTGLTGTMVFDKTNGVVTWPFTPGGWVGTSTNTALYMNVSGEDVNGVLGYILRETE